MDDDRQEQIKAQAHLELIVQDMEESVSANVEMRRRVEREIRELREKIGEKEGESERVRPEFEEALRKEVELKERYVVLCYCYYWYRYVVLFDICPIL